MRYAFRTKYAMYTSDLYLFIYFFSCFISKPKTRWFSSLEPIIRNPVAYRFRANTHARCSTRVAVHWQLRRPNEKLALNMLWSESKTTVKNEKRINNKKKIWDGTRKIHFFFFNPEVTRFRVNIATTWPVMVFAARLFTRIDKKLLGLLKGERGKRMNPPPPLTQSNE